MRSMKIDRKPRGRDRVKTARKSPRPGRDLPPVQPGSARRGKAGPGLAGRLFAPLARLMARPMLALSCGLVLLVLLGALLASGVVGRGARGLGRGTSALVAQAGFGVYEIQITGNRRIPTGTLFAALGLTPGQSIFFIDLPAARKRLMALDWVVSAEVVRRYPDRITVTVVEKRPFALWQTPATPAGPGRLAVVERSGGVITTQLTPAAIEKFSHLPKLIGAGAPDSAADLVDAVMNHRAVSARTIAFERVSRRRWNLILNDGVVVKLPEAGWAKELDALEHLIVDNAILERDVTEIDLRSAARYFFLLKSGEKKDVERGKET